MHDFGEELFHMRIVAEPPVEVAIARTVMHSCPSPLRPPRKLLDARRLFNTATVRSKISYIDGDKGILRYRGYPIEQLAEKSSFLEVRSPCSAQTPKSRTYRPAG